MGVNYFTEEQVRELEKNPYVTKVSNKSITYAEEFKELFWIDYQNGIQPIEIFKKYGFDPNVLGAKRRNTFTNRIKKQVQRVEGFKDTRKDKCYLYICPLWPLQCSILSLLILSFLIL